MPRRNTLRLVRILFVSSCAFSSLSSTARADSATKNATATARTLLDYPLRDLNGDTHSLSEYRGEVVVVNFWASWCAPCLLELPALDAWNARWLGKGARVVAISVDHEEDNVRRFVTKSKLSLEVCQDGPDGLAKALDLPSLPCTYVLDQSGQLALVTGKSGDEALSAVEKTVARLVGSTETANAPTMAPSGGTR